MCKERYLFGLLQNVTLLVKLKFKFTILALPPMIRQCGEIMPPPAHLKGNYRVYDKCQQVFHNSLILLFVAYSMWSMVYVSLTNENRNKLHILLSTAFAMFLLKFMFQPCKNISYHIKYNFLPSMHSKSVANCHPPQQLFPGTGNLRIEAF